LKPLRGTTDSTIAEAVTSTSRAFKAITTISRLSF